MDFFAKVETRARAIDSLLCVGIDPVLSTSGDVGKSLRDTCFKLMDATRDHACAFKMNSAYFEAYGADGISALVDVVKHAGDVPAILDFKRGDIAETNDAYARFAFDVVGAGAVTVAPYMGGEPLNAFTQRAGKGVFVLCRTSNPGADELQGLRVSPHGEALFEFVARRAPSWGESVGLVVGATAPQALMRVRELAPKAWLLVPGVGAQGGDLNASLQAGLRGDGLGMLVNASRSIAKASDPGAEAKKLKEQIAASKKSKSTSTPNRTRGLAQQLAASGCVKFGEFTLKSGKKSPIYMDLRQLVSFPDVMASVAAAYARVLADLRFDRLVGIPYAALPIATAVSLVMNRPLIYPRREAKQYGTKATIEGAFIAGEVGAVIDDLATTGDTKLEAIEKLTSEGIKVTDVVVLIDREQGAKELLAKSALVLHSVVKLTDVLMDLKDAGVITAQQFSDVTEFLKNG